MCWSLTAQCQHRVLISRFYLVKFAKSVALLIDMMRLTVPKNHDDHEG